MSKIIFLNGCGSSGKTSIAKNIQDISEQPWLHLGIDTFIDLLPKKFIADGEKAKEGYYTYINSANSNGNIAEVKRGPLGNMVFPHLTALTKILADAGNNLIIDEVIFEDETLKNYIIDLNHHHVYFIGVFCELQTLQQREVSRGDRIIGLANNQISKVHKDIKEYDLKIDTTYLPSINAASIILNFIELNSNPKIFKEMHQAFTKS